MSPPEETQSGGIQIKGSKPRKEAGRYPSWQCKSTPKIAHIEEIQQKDQVKKFPLNSALIRIVHSKNR